MKELTELLKQVASPHTGYCVVAEIYQPMLDRKSHRNREMRESPLKYSAECNSKLSENETTCFEESY